jgi:hypothetical protein
MNTLNTISIDAVISAAEGQVFSNLDGQIAILNLKTGMYYGLDEIGARIWNLIQEPASISSIRDILLEEYDVEPEQCAIDLLDLVEELAAAGLVKLQSN